MAHQLDIIFEGLQVRVIWVIELHLEEALRIWWLIQGQLHGRNVSEQATIKNTHREGKKVMCAVLNKAMSACSAGKGPPR